tara:strand:- start:349 stop:546 length:198 start_codon:yes stop_codon:yes gene_type:complete
MKGGPGKNKQGDPMKPHKKKYGGGGMAEEDATKQQKEMMAARKTEPTGRLTGRDVEQAVKRAGLK